MHRHVVTGKREKLVVVGLDGKRRGVGASVRLPLGEGDGIPPPGTAVHRRGHYNGPARVAGSAGTGKTVVALHRSGHLARTHPEARVLLTTFNDTLANALRVKLGRLVGSRSGVYERVAVSAIDRVAMQLYEAALGPVALVGEQTVRSLLREASRVAEASRFSERFLETEWQDVVDAWQLSTWESGSVRTQGFPGTEAS